jgi:hypothetical protein
MNTRNKLKFLFLKKSLLGLVLMCFITSGCAPGISLYSENAYDQAVTLKINSLRLIDHATEPYSDHAQDVESLMYEIDKAYEYAKGRPRNELSAWQWKILKDPDGHLLGGFIIRWKEQETLSTPFITESKGVISDAFDTLIGLESGKIRPSEVR